MKKGTKIIVGIMIAIIFGYVLVNVYQNTKNEEKKTNELVNENNDATKIEYQLKNEDNEITLTAIGEGEVSITRYLFSGDELTDIYVIEQIEQMEFIDAVYESIKNDELMNQIYDSIEIKDNEIIMKLKEEYVKTFEGKGKQEIYEELENEF